MWESSQGYRRAEVWGVRTYDRKMVEEVFRRAKALKPGTVPMLSVKKELAEKVLKAEGIEELPANEIEAID